MSLRAKITIILSGVLALFLVLHLVVQRLVITTSFATLERNEARKDLERCRKALDKELSHLRQVCADWASWDDTYEFIVEPGEEYVESNLVKITFTDNNINLIRFYNREGELVWGAGFRLDPWQPVEVAELSSPRLEPGHPLLADNPKFDGTGILLTDQGPILVSAQPILTSDSEGPVRGTLIMGRFLEPDVVAGLAEQARVDFKVWPSQEESIPDEDRPALAALEDEGPVHFNQAEKKVLKVYSLFPDIRGRPALLLRVDFPREITLQGRRALRFANYSILAVGIYVLLVLMFLIQRAVVAPLTKLTDHALALGQSDDLGARLKMGRGDEIGTLAREFDRMVDRLEATRRKLLEKSYHLGRTEMAAGVLHNIRNAMTPIIVRVEELGQELAGSPLARLEEASAELEQGSSSSQRRSDLKEYLELAGEELGRLRDRLETGLAGVAKSLADLEAILVEQGRTGRVGPLLESVRLDKLVEDAREMMPQNLREGVEIRINPGLAEMGPLSLQRLSILQVMGNLLNNAAESILGPGFEERKGLVTIDGELAEENGRRMVHLRVGDNGQGLDQEGLKRIFNQGYSTKERSFSGLGLHWCANTVNSLRGRLWAESPGPGLGAVFHLLIPIEVRA
jgi:sensor domain CHASE-containing protein